MSFGGPRITPLTVQSGSGKAGYGLRRGFAGLFIDSSFRVIVSDYQHLHRFKNPLSFNASLKILAEKLSEAKVYL
jgi:hypothetical protein